MSERIAVVGIGATQFRTITPDVSYKELMFDAAVRAYADAGINPRTEVDTFVTCAEDYIEGTSIFDEYVPDQLGAALRQMHTITGDGLHGIATAVMQLRTGRFGTAVVEAHSKASNMLTPDGIAACAQDPVTVRPLCLNSNFIAGLEMNRFCAENGITRDQCSAVAVKNRSNALVNPIAGQAAGLSLDDFKYAKPVSLPLTDLDIAQPVDGAIVIVLATESKAKELRGKPVWLTGAGWCNGSPNLETRDWSAPEYVTKAAKMAYGQAGVTDPRHYFDFAEVDDTYTYKELQHLVALGLASPCDVGLNTEQGKTARNGKRPVNVSGGALGMGYMYEASGLARFYCAVQQLRGEAGAMQLPKAKTAIVQAWRGVPTASTAVITLAA
ncbi:acetyl-CoA acetyltransferase [candidate division WOR-3 bacterium]|uniref:Acetyl-CoA acetyltransferase n=1 Tax=candidate division WOR-3 bacterium TaxID=2052148 RepID=A0A938BQ71_UNCW3|nr:acetyl-CoA acetyltransferase [candidate division WOR-3 bacterium]